MFACHPPLISFQCLATVLGMHEIREREVHNFMLGKARQFHPPNVDKLQKALLNDYDGIGGIADNIFVFDLGFSQAEGFFLEVLFQLFNTGS